MIKRSLYHQTREVYKKYLGLRDAKKNGGLIVVVKKTFRYSNVFFYNDLCRVSVIRNIIMKSGINCVNMKKVAVGWQLFR